MYTINSAVSVAFAAIQSSRSAGEGNSQSTPRKCNPKYRSSRNTPYRRSLVEMPAGGIVLLLPKHRMGRRPPSSGRWKMLSTPNQKGAIKLLSSGGGLDKVEGCTRVGTTDGVAGVDKNGADGVLS